MAVYRVERTRDYTVMSNHHLKDPGLSLKAKGLLAIMLSLPDDWNYSTRGLAAICKEGVEAIGNTLKELERAGYVVRRQLRGEHGRVGSVEYTIYEKPQTPPPGLWPGRTATVHGFTVYGFPGYGKAGRGFPGCGCAGYGKPGAIKY